MDPITQQLTVKAGPDEAYAAVATGAGIKAWWCTDSQVGESVGAPTTLRFNPANMPGPVTMQFLTETLESGKRVVWACTANDNPAWPGTTLTWEIASQDGGSSVNFTHDGWKDGGQLYDQTVEGWRYFMDSLQTYLDGGEPTPSP
jgi:uncharacterized protein YndB with AHSA1/START domain